MSSPIRPPESAARFGVRWVDLFVLIVAVWTVVVIPARVVGVGYRPTDDARRHAAKVLAERSWDEILVLRPEVTVDPHPGWHAVLAAAHRAGIETATGLVVFSSFALAVLFLATPLLLRLGRPETWLIALLAVALAVPDFLRRLMLGRPLVFAMSVMLAVAVLWPRLRGERFPVGWWGATTALLGLAVWIHGNWYLWILPLAAFVAAGELRVGARFAGAAAVATVLGALATGTPFAFLAQTARHPFWATATDLPKRILVAEFQPSDGDLWMTAAVLALVAMKARRGESPATLARDPVFLLAAGGWALGLHTVRFWWDWGLPACLVWIAREIDRGLAATPLRSRRRAAVAVIVATVLLLAFTADRGSRWSSTRSAPFLSAENPAHRPWLPGPGGVLYSNEMRVFYNTFFRNPTAPWRYVLGFEPALMPADDLAVFRRIQLDYASDASFAPWVAKMRPEDRLVVVRSQPGQPRIPRLEWHSPYRGMWIGRLPPSGSSTTPVDAAKPGDSGGSLDGAGRAATEEAATRAGSEVVDSH